MRHCVLGTYNSPSYPSPMSFTHLAKERGFSGRFNYPVAIFESQHLSSCKPAIHQPCNELVINLYLYCRTNIALSWMAEWQRQTSCAFTDCLPHRMATSGSHPPCMTNLEKFHIRRGVEKKKQNDEVRPAKGHGVQHHQSQYSTSPFDRHCCLQVDSNLQDRNRRDRYGSRRPLQIISLPLRTAGLLRASFMKLSLPSLAPLQTV